VARRVFGHNPRRDSAVSPVLVPGRDHGTNVRFTADEYAELAAAAALAGLTTTGCVGEAAWGLGLHSICWFHTESGVRRSLASRGCLSGVAVRDIAATLKMVHPRQPGRMHGRPALIAADQRAPDEPLRSAESDPPRSRDDQQPVRRGL
jgi:hypothetical protein